MKLFFKNQTKSYFIVLILQFVALAGLVNAGNESLMGCFETLLGNKPFSWILDRTGFYIVILSLQLLNGNAIIYYLQNKSYYYVRAVSEKQMVSQMMIKILLNLLVFMGMFLAVYFIINGAMLQIAEPVVPVTLCLCMVKGFGKLFLFSCLQVLLLLYLDVEKAFLGFVIGIVVFSYLNFLAVGIPIQNEWLKLLVAALFYLVVSKTVVTIVNKIYRREKCRYGY